MNEYELLQEKERLTLNLDGRKTYLYKEEVQRDQRELNRIIAELKSLEENA